MVNSKKNKIEFICSSCGAKFPKWRGQCICSKWSTIKEREITPKKHSIARVSPKRKEDNKQPDIHQEELDKWFEMQRKLALTGSHVCAECGVDVSSDLLSGETWIWRRVLCHIFPKSRFPSVQTHPLNCIILCWQHHSTMDSSWSKAKEMKVWELVVSKAKVISKQISESRGKLPEELFVD